MTDDLERAHIVDRLGWDNGAGLDGPQNLALLCGVCHKQMPIIEPENWRVGLRYVGLDRIRNAFAAGTLPIDPLPFSAMETRRVQEEMDRGKSPFRIVAELIESADPAIRAQVMAVFGVQSECKIDAQCGSDLRESGDS